MRLLVTGGAGYIGSHFCKLAKRAGHEVVVFDNLTTGHKKFVKFGPLVKGDVRNLGQLEDALRYYEIEGVVHFAGKALVGESMEHPELYYSNNTVGAAVLLQAMQNRGVRTLVFSSSCATYGLSEGETLTESSPQRPINPYGRSKLQSEEIILDFNRYKDFRVAILRYFNVIGQDPERELWEEHVPETHILPNLLKAAREEGVFKLFGRDYATSDGTCIRDYVDVNDLGAAHLEALKVISTRTLLISNVGRGKGYSNLEVLKAVEKACGQKVRMEDGPRRPGDPPILVANAENFKSWFKNPLRSLEESIKGLT